MQSTVRVTALLVVVAIGSGCQATPGSSIGPPVTVAGTAPLPSVPTVGSVAASPRAVAELSGTVAFSRVDAGGVEHYFTIRPDGSNEHHLFSIQGCSCIQLSPTGETVWALSETENGTVAFTTMSLVGRERRVHVPPTETLSLAAGPDATTPDGSLIAFFGWDDTRADAAGLYVAGPDLKGLRQVIPLSTGVNGVEPYGVTPDGTRVVFFAERGSVGSVTHAGDLFVVDADGRNLRQLNSDELTLGTVRGVPASLSPDGTRVAFAAFEGTPDRSAVYVASLDGGFPQRITEVTSGIWSAAWAPVGGRITFATWSNGDAVNAIVNADGTGRRDLPSPADGGGFGAWSPTGAHLLVSRGPDGSRDLWIVDLEGNFVSQVTHQPADYALYRWG